MFVSFSKVRLELNPLCGNILVFLFGVKLPHNLEKFPTFIEQHRDPATLDEGTRQLSESFFDALTFHLFSVGGSLMKRILCGLVIFGVVSCLTLGGNIARGLTISATSEGYGLSVDVDAIALSVDVGPLPVGISGTAPGPYSDSASVLNVNVDGSVAFVVSSSIEAGAVNASASSNVDGLPGNRDTSASGGIVGANFDVLTLPLFWSWS